jgi:hypothetical protein
MRDVVCHMCFPLTGAASCWASLLLRDRTPSDGIISMHMGNSKHLFRHTPYDLTAMSGTCRVVGTPFVADSSHGTAPCSQGAHVPYHPSDSTALLSISTATARWINSILTIKRAADFLVSRMPSTPAKGPWVTRIRMPSTRYGCGS